jgi:hypothetical protein
MTDAEISYRVRHRVTNPAEVIYNKRKQGNVSYFVHLSVYLRLFADLILVKNNYVRWQQIMAVEILLLHVYYYISR